MRPSTEPAYLKAQSEAQSGWRVAVAEGQRLAALRGELPGGFRIALALTPMLLAVARVRRVRRDPALLPPVERSSPACEGVAARDFWR